MTDLVDDQVRIGDVLPDDIRTCGKVVITRCEMGFEGLEETVSVGLLVVGIMIGAGRVKDGCDEESAPYL